MSKCLKNGQVNTRAAAVTLKSINCLIRCYFYETLFYDSKNRSSTSIASMRIQRRQ